MRYVLAVTALALMAAAPVHDARVQASMKTVVGPSSDLLFAVGGEVDPDSDPAASAKVPAARWMAASEAAERLKSAAALMLDPAEVRKGTWKSTAEQMASLSNKAAIAARSHDAKTLTQAANDLGDTCSACHSTYKPQT